MRRAVSAAAAVTSIAAVLLAGCGGSSHHSRARTATAQQTAAVAAPSATVFGATVNTLFKAPPYSAAQAFAELAALRTTGATLARSDSLWEKVEGSPPSNGVHHYDWGFDDAVAGTLAGEGLTWLPILDYFAGWARADGTQLHSPPRTPDDFAAYAGALAARYGPGGTYWRSHPSLTPRPVTTYEVWNEPDGGFWYPAPNAAAYADLYLATRRAVDASVPGSRVVIGGLTHAETFLPAMLAARPELAGHVDGVGIHIYETTPKHVFSRVRAIRRVLSEHGFGSVPLYITEIGWSTLPLNQSVNPYGAPERLRPSYIARTIGALGHSDCGIGAILVYSWITKEVDPGYLEDWYGINPPPGRGASSPDVRAFVGAMHSAQAASASGAAPARICGG